MIFAFKLEKYQVMKGFVEYLISECDNNEKEQAKAYDKHNAILSHQELLAFQLSGVKDEWIVHAANGNTSDLLKRQRVQSNLDKATRILRQQQALDIKTFSFLDTLSYPGKLNDLGDSRPVFLHCLGDTNLLLSETVAVVGSRNASRQGLLMAKDFGIIYGSEKEDKRQWYNKTGCPPFVAFPYSQKSPYVVVTGLTTGCDTAASKGCLSVDGSMIAVVPTGLDLALPQEHNDLKKRILENGGLIVSEQILGVQECDNLIARNRIQAALADIIIVAECGKKSETMNTVDYATKLNRKILTVEYGYINEFNSGNAAILKKKLGAKYKFPF